MKLTFWMHVHQATPLQRHLHPIHFQWSTHVLAHLPSSRATMLAHAFSTPTNITEFGRISYCCICWNNSIAFPPLPAFHMSQYHGSPSYHILRGYLVEHSPSNQSRLPHFAYMSTKLHPNKDFRLTTSLDDMFHEQVYPSSRALKPAHTLITWTKVN